METEDLAKKNILDFLAVAAEYCALVEQADIMSQKAFVDKARKVLALLYLKVSLLPEIEPETDSFVEKFVTENDWNFIQAKVSEKLGVCETYFDVVEPMAYDTTNETVNVSTSETFADIYQDLRDMLEVYRVAEEEEQQIALAECVNNYRSFWGVRALLLMNELHLLVFSDTELDDNVENLNLG